MLCRVDSHEACPFKKNERLPMHAVMILFLLSLYMMYTACALVFLPPQRPYFWNSQSRLSSGQTWRVLSQREMQWKWKACYTLKVSSKPPCISLTALLTLQIPQATVHSSEVAEAWLAWQSIQRSMMWLRQMAQLSTTMSQAQRATAFHCVWLARVIEKSCVDVKTHLLDLETRLALPTITAWAGLAAFRLWRIHHLYVGHL